MTSTRPVETHDGIITDWLALTTPGPPLPSGCTNNIFINGQAFVRFDNFFGIEVNPGLSCYPKEVYQWWSQPVSQQSSTTLLGPFQCPNGFTTASTSSGGHTDSTLVGCCPSSYTFLGWNPNGDAAQCGSTLTPGQILTVKTLKDSSSMSITTTTIIAESRSVQAAHVNGYIFPNSSTTASSSSSLSDSSSSVISATASPAISPTNSATIQPTSSASLGLSTGVKAGISVSVTLGVLGILCLVIWLRKRKAKTIKPKIEDGAGSQFQRTNAIQYHEAEGDLQIHEAPEGKPKHNWRLHEI